MYSVLESKLQNQNETHCNLKSTPQNSIHKTKDTLLCATSLTGESD